MQTIILTSSRLRNHRSAWMLAVGCAMVIVSGLAQAEDESIEGVLAETDSEMLDMQQMITAGEYALPEAWLNARVKKIQRSSHRYDPALVQPLTLLGDISAAQGESDKALDYYGQALHIQRVSAGLVSAEQLQIVHREADVYRSLGNLKRANEREEYAYHVLRRSHESTDEALLPGLFRLADWYIQTHNIFAAQALYQQCLNILTANGDGDSLQAVPALQGLLRTYRLANFPAVLQSVDPAAGYSNGLTQTSQFDVPIRIGGLSEGESVLQQLVQIRRDNGNEPLQVAEAVLDLADWYLLFNRYDRAVPLYDFAYDLLNADEAIDAVGYFASPKLLHFPAPVDPQPPSLTGGNEPATGFVELRYDITDEGYIRNLETLASNPARMMDFRVRKSMRAARFRPALRDGVPIASEDQIFRHEFTYYPSQPEVAQEAASTEAVQ